MEYKSRLRNPAFFLVLQLLRRFFKLSVGDPFKFLIVNDLLSKIKGEQEPWLSF
jgi:hypothetical protein